MDIDGRTPLHLAACTNSLEAVKYLVANGANVMISDLRGNDPVTDAIREGNLGIHVYLDEVMSESIVK